MELQSYDIALACYNGEKYIEAQLNSIIKSVSFCKIAKLNKIIISDDNSTDNTIELVERLFQNNPCINIYINKGKKGVKNNFQNALSFSSSEYVFLSDQDDLWHENKIERSMAEMLKVKFENKLLNIPILIFSNLNFVDENLNLLSVGLGINSDDPKNPSCTAYRSYGQGCTMLMNRELLNISGPIPEESVMHDWWFLLVASNFGIVSYINVPLMDYRQHNNNVCGGYQNKKLNRFFNIKKQTDYLNDVSKQSLFFTNKYYDMLSVNELRSSLSLHEFFANIDNIGISTRIAYFFKRKIKVRGIKDNIKLILQLLLK
ncbi:MULTISPECIES: glycosyltransferase family 2 protein [Elizabethkingia]|uniref:glycosyltransferase family 2 protein n=1 Tax=Elizabethkingia TaxID=308865 RepID=UPI00063A9C17|nr:MULTISPECIES: glycosyltransferase family 2 protein [Elizabethkingia]AKH95617.1 hypothetical protein M876_13675 [Elizabethkingia anophelis FMS-007]MCT3663409.1 glycosyltransferase family 2 protein [Elizabethkingia anophelis]MCT3673506.1 glycosyltransferase family 2 protein [Elizabethkingia anophelis]MCT3680921.1 glycosyltransferase family 2 protein [Elizabethkingia anophelis]MCT3703477.1 glycosyltransferase family 2 protein [Elizabethkingia anophelis]